MDLVSVCVCAICETLQGVDCVVAKRKSALILMVVGPWDVCGWFEIGAEEETVRGAMIGLIQLSRKSIVAHYEHIWGICEVGKTHITMSIDLYVDTYIYIYGYGVLHVFG